MRHYKLGRTYIAQALDYAVEILIRGILIVKDGVEFVVPLDKEMNNLVIERKPLPGSHSCTWIENNRACKCRAFHTDPQIPNNNGKLKRFRQCVWIRPFSMLALYVAD